MSPLWPGLMKRNYFIQIWKFLPIFFFFYYTYLILFCSLFKILWYWHELWHTKSENIHHVHMYIIIQPWINVKKIINNSDCFFYNCMKHSNSCWNLLYCMYPTIYNCKSLLIIFVMFFFRSLWTSLLIPIDSLDEVKYRSQHHRIIISYVKYKIAI